MIKLTERETRDNEPIDSKPPVLGSWRNVYWFVAGFFFVELVVFYLITRYYS